MGFFNKIKDILFEEVEDEESNSEVRDVKTEVKKPIAEKIEPQRKPEEAPIVREAPKPRVNTEVPKEEKYDTLNEIDLFKSENTFPFPDFDEEEFSNSMSRVQKTKPTTNVLEYEKKKKVEKKYDYGRYERVDKTEVVEKKKFKPSPIISPVYGILNEDYKIEDIKDKSEVKESNKIDFDSVRKKAFESVEKPEEQPKEIYYEETVTVKLKENDEDKKKKVKTIDELLEDTADVAINVNPTTDVPNVSEYENVEQELEDITPKNASKSESDGLEDNDTLENDLFDLIDSMYDNREDGEY